MIKTFPSICASVAGNPSSLGVKMHNAGYLAKKIDFTYIAMGATDVEEAITVFKTLNYKGMGVSMPFKQTVIKYLDDIDVAVEKIGACNTVVNKNGRLVGYNTDWMGALNAIKEIANIDTIEKAVIVGAGGVARAIAYALKHEGKKVFISARKEQQRKLLVNDLGLDGHSSIENQFGFDAELVVNATPCAKKQGPVILEKHKAATVLLDVVFQTKMTELTEYAKSLGLKYASGWRMLLLQGAKQFELYTGESAPLKEMGQVLENWLDEK